MTNYLDTSGAAKLLVEESESPALRAFLVEASSQGTTIISSRLLETELRRFCIREGIDQIEVAAVLGRLDMVELDAACFRQAGLLPGPNLRSLDAIHVAAALRGGADSMITYDQRQAGAARAVGLDVVSPS